VLLWRVSALTMCPAGAQLRRRRAISDEGENMAQATPRARRVGVVGISLLALVALFVLAASSVAGSKKKAASKVVTAAPARVVSSSPVTLITGDKVVLTTLSNGDQAVTLATTGKVASRPLSTAFHAVKQNGDLYVWPVDIQPYVGTLLDQELFNVSKLVRQGYGDRASATIPMIVDYGTTAAATALPAAMARARTLSSIGAVSGRESKRNARQLAQQLRRQLATGNLRSGPFAGIHRIYLDEQVTVALADSVPQIGAPLAWAAGYDGTGVKVAVLDTGVDETHPDLAGKVVLRQNFTTEGAPDDTHDGFGHGTHVADIVAGSGAASGGLRKGVAPGAQLLMGKVVDSTGNGLESQAIAGMEWAAANGADVISMSLQYGITGGEGLVSQAANRLTTDDGVLFTVAAGNFGAAQTVSDPGAASLALTVGAVTKQDVLAGFSSRGPLLNNYGLKPDLTAPGVDIIAARAAGTALGPVVDDVYVMLSGTSMATPHVAGAAAILKQEYPSFTPAQLKAALTSTTKPGPYTVYEQGTGRVDVGRAYSQKVYQDGGSLDFGYFPYPHDADTPITKSVTYSNYTSSDVTLNLNLDVNGDRAGPPADGMIALSSPTVTVPAGGTASVDVTVDTRVGDPSLYGGVLSAQNADGSVQLRTAIGFYDEPIRVNLTVSAIARDGTPAKGISWLDVVNADDTTLFNQRVDLNSGPVTLRVPPGHYSVMGLLFTYDGAGIYATEAAVAGNPDLDVESDTTYVADARPATELIANTPQATSPQSMVLGTYRAGGTNGSFESLLLTGPPTSRYFAAPTDPVTVGDFGFRAKETLMAPPLALSVSPGKTTLQGFYATGSKLVDGTLDLPLVYAGYGRVQDFEGLDVHGKAVLVTRGPLPPVGDPITFAEKVANATAAGASFLLIANHSPGLLLVGLSAPSQIPVVTLTQAQGVALQAQLEAGRELTLHAKGVAQSPYKYDVLWAEQGQIQADHTKNLDATNTVRIKANWHAQVAGTTAGDVRHGYPPWSGFSFDSAINFTAPFVRREYVPADGNGSWLHTSWGSMTGDFVFGWSQQGPQVSYPTPGRWTEDWMSQPQAPNIIEHWVEGDTGQPVTRTGDAINAFVPEWFDDSQHFGLHDTRTDTADLTLSEDGTQIAESEGWLGTYDVSPGSHRYRAELDVTRSAPFITLSTHTHTLWAFRSATPADGVTQVLPLLVADWSFGGLDLLGQASRGTQKIVVSVHRQTGADASSVDDFTAQVSYDDGDNWTTVPARSLGDGRYRITVQQPEGDTSDFVSVRVDATDDGGSRINQTIIRAYALKD
jgi:subtilisin family serine protease